MHSLCCFTLILTLLLPIFFFNDTATTEIYTLSLHDALPICGNSARMVHPRSPSCCRVRMPTPRSCSCEYPDRKSTRLNSSHGSISYAVFCLKKKKKKKLRTDNHRYKHKNNRQKRQTYKYQNT